MKKTNIILITMSSLLFIVGFLLGNSFSNKTIGCTGINYIHGNILHARYGEKLKILPDKLNVAISTDLMRLCQINPFDKSSLQDYVNNNSVRNYLQENP